MDPEQWERYWTSDDQRFVIKDAYTMGIISVEEMRRRLGWSEIVDEWQNVGPTPEEEQAAICSIIESARRLHKEAS